jgi:hypothetical protein
MSPRCHGSINKYFYAADEESIIPVGAARALCERNVSRYMMDRLCLVRAVEEHTFRQVVKSA